MPATREDQGASHRPPHGHEAAAVGRGAVGDQAHRRADARAGRRRGLRRGHVFDMDGNSDSTELWLFPTGLAGKSAAKARRLTAGEKDSDPKWSPAGDLIAFTAKRKDDDEPQIYLIAPDGGEARRLTSLATGCTAIKWFPDGKRIAFVSWVWRDLASDAEQAKRKKERKDGEGQGARHRARRVPLLGPLAHRRPRAARVRVRRGHRPLPRRAGGHRPRAAAVGAERRATSTSRPTAASSRSTADLGPEPRMMAQRDIVTRRSCHAAQARADRRDRDRRRVADLFAGRARARVSVVRHQSIVQRPGARDAARAPHGPHAGAGAGARSASRARSRGRATRARSCARSRITAGSASSGSRPRCRAVR